MTNNFYLVWLEWPEKCFRVDAEALRYLKSVVPAGSRVVRARSEAVFLRDLPKATHAVVWNFKREWFSRASRLKVLATPAAGKELVPTEGPEGVEIHFGHFHGEIMAESAVGFIMAWARGFFFVGRAPESERAWPRTWLSDKCREVAGTRAVILGYGNVGKAVARKLAAVGVSSVGITRHGVYSGSSKLREVEVSDCLRQADWLVMVLPSTTGTDDYLDAKLIRKLPRRCVVVNIGRGNSIDEEALYSALSTNRLAGAYLDVRKHEPSGTVPEFGKNVGGLDSLPNCVITPHSSAFSPRYVLRCFEELKNDGCI